MVKLSLEEFHSSITFVVSRVIFCITLCTTIMIRYAWANSADPDQTVPRGAA